MTLNLVYGIGNTLMGRGGALVLGICIVSAILSFAVVAILPAPDGFSLAAGIIAAWFASWAVVIAAAMAFFFRARLAALNDAIDATHAAVAIYDPDDRLVFSNGAYVSMLGLADKDLYYGAHYRDIISGALAQISDPQTREEELSQRLRFHARSDNTPIERTYAKGRTMRVTKTRTPLGNSIGVGVDVTEANTLRADLRRQNEVFLAVAEAAPIGLLHIDGQGGVVFANRAALGICGYRGSIDKSATQFALDGADGEGTTMSLTTLVEASSGQDLEVSTIVDGVAAGDTLIVRQSRLNSGDASGDGDNAGAGERVLLFIDITARKAAEEQIRYYATHDPLTGAKNRIAFATKLESFSQNSGHAAPTHLIAIDLDKFKPINDQYGHMVGDAVLQQIARRMTRALEPQMTLFRMGGDEFAILCDPVQDTNLVAFCDGLLRAIEAPLTVPGAQVSVSASIGISSFPHDTDKLDSLAHYADLALYNVKDAGGGRMATYSGRDAAGGRELTDPAQRPDDRLLA